MLRARVGYAAGVEIQVDDGLVADKAVGDVYSAWLRGC